MIGVWLEIHDTYINVVPFLAKFKENTTIVDTHYVNYIVYIGSTNSYYTHIDAIIRTACFGLKDCYVKNDNGRKYVEIRYKGFWQHNLVCVLQNIGMQMHGIKGIYNNDMIRPIGLDNTYEVVGQYLIPEQFQNKSNKCCVIL